MSLTWVVTIGGLFFWVENFINMDNISFLMLRLQTSPFDFLSGIEQCFQCRCTDLPNWLKYIHFMHSLNAVYYYLVDGFKLFWNCRGIKGEKRCLVFQNKIHYNTKGFDLSSIFAYDDNCFQYLYSFLDYDNPILKTMVVLFERSLKSMRGRRSESH